MVMVCQEALGEDTMGAADSKRNSPSPACNSPDLDESKIADALTEHAKGLQHLELRSDHGHPCKSTSVPFFHGANLTKNKWNDFLPRGFGYSTLLKANGEDVKVVQELMRHANISTTMNIYTKALTSAKREAQSRVVDVLLDRSRNVVESAAEDAA